MDWSHENPGHRNDIMAYRLHQPEQSAESVGVKVEVPVSLPDGYGEVINTTLVEVGGPHLPRLGPGNHEAYRAAWLAEQYKILREQGLIL